MCCEGTSAGADALHHIDAAVCMSHHIMSPGGKNQRAFKARGEKLPPFSAGLVLLVSTILLFRAREQRVLWVWFLPIFMGTDSSDQADQCDDEIHRREQLHNAFCNTCVL